MRRAPVRTLPRSAGWRFGHPDLDAPGRAGLRLSPRGGVEMVEGDDAVRQAILLLLSTVPGERVMRPDYGCELHSLVFAPNDDTTAGLAIHYVRRALERWERRIDLVALDAGRHPERPEALMISLSYRVRASQRREVLEIAFDLGGVGA